MTIDEFLLARVAEDDEHFSTHGRDRGWPESFINRLLADCEAKRVAVWWYVNDDHVVMEATIMAMAAAYCAHPDYDPVWAAWVTR